MSEDLQMQEVKKQLNTSRFRMGFAQLFFSGEESTLGGLKVLIIKMLGGNDLHLAVTGSFGGLVSFTQCLAVPLLKMCKSNRLAMIVSLLIGVAGGVLLALSVLGGLVESMQGLFLWVFLISILVMSVATGVQLAIETNWIGDLVPQNCRGWFTSIKSIISLIGMSLLALLFGFIVDNMGSLILAGVGCFLVVALSHVLAICLIKEVPDREPKIKPIFEGGKITGLNLKSYALWCYIAFYMLWTGGRALFATFSTIFILTEFKMGLVQLSGFTILNQTMSCIMLFVLGRMSDKRGNRKLLAFISFCVSMSMFSYLTTPFLGVIPLIATSIIGGMAGLTHGMLVVNYSLEIIPEEGRATYISFIRMVMGAWTILVVNIGGVIAHALEKSNFTFEMFGKTFSRYHIMFAIGAAMAGCCVIPLLMAGARKIKNVDLAQ
ncbi:MAG: MFS transporter [Lentisphaerae bacterium]|nr:MFS transporter [Lentisphaerota bacterium]